MLWNDGDGIFKSMYRNQLKVREGQQILFTFSKYNIGLKLTSSLWTLSVKTSKIYRRQTSRVEIVLS